MHTWIVFDLAGVVAQMFFGNQAEVMVEGERINLNGLRAVYALPAYRGYMKGDVSEDALIEEFLRNSGSPVTATQVKEVMRSVAFEVPGIMDILHDLQKHYRLALATNEGHEWAQGKVDVLGLDQIFDQVIESNVLGKLKPEPEFFLEMLRLIDAEPSQVVFIDDRRENCESAERLGIRSIPFTNAPDLRADLRTLGVEI